MKRIFFRSPFFVLIAFLVLVCAEGSNAWLSPDKERFGLNDQEQQEAAAAVSDRTQAEQAWALSIQAALNTPPKAQESTEAQCNMQVAFWRKEAMKARYEATLAKHRLAHNCAECEYTPDLKALEKPKPKPAQP